MKHIYMEQVIEIIRLIYKTLTVNGASSYDYNVSPDS